MSAPNNERRPHQSAEAARKSCDGDVFTVPAPPMFCPMFWWSS